MNRLIYFEMLLFVVAMLGSLSGFISVLRAGQLFLGIGILNLIIGIAALLGWPMPRGDVANHSPLSGRDFSDMARDVFNFDHDRPTKGFAIRVAVIGIIAIGVGLVLILFWA